MTNQNNIDAAEAARISRDIQDTGGFLEDLIDDPASVQQIPSGSTLVFRTIRVLDEHVRLTAFRPSGSGAEWSSRVTSRTALGDGANGGHPRLPLQDPVLDEVAAHGKTANDALDALEAALHDRARLPSDPLQRHHRR